MSVEAAIVEYAESEGVDLIIIGTKGTSDIKNMLLDNIASGVVKYSMPRNGSKIMVKKDAT